MADYTPPPWAQLVAGKPWTDEKAAASFENPIAMFEGKGPTKLAPRALASNLLGAVSGMTGLSDLGDFAAIRATAVSAAATDLQVSFSTDNGTSWGGWQTVASPPGGVSMVGHQADFEINLLTGVLRGIALYFPASGQAIPAVLSATLTVPASCNAVRFGPSSVVAVLVTAEEGRVIA